MDTHKSLLPNIAIALLCLAVGCQPAGSNLPAEPAENATLEREFPFLGTWKVDTSEMWSDSPEDNSRRAILDRQRWVLGKDRKATITTNGVPNSKSWRLTKPDGPPFEIEFTGENVEPCTVTMSGEQQMTLTFPIEGSQAFELNFVRVSNQPPAD